MDLVTAIFSVARQVSDSDLNEVNKLHEKAKNEVVQYHTDMGGIKGTYAKLHKGWIFQTVLIFATPFITTWLLAKKQQILNSANKSENDDFEDFEDEDYEDDDERKLYEQMKLKYGN